MSIQQPSTPNEKFHWTEFLIAFNIENNNEKKITMTKSVFNMHIPNLHSSLLFFHNFTDKIVPEVCNFALEMQNKCIETMDSDPSAQKPDSLKKIVEYVNIINEAIWCLHIFLVKLLEKIDRPFKEVSIVLNKIFILINNIYKFCIHSEANYKAYFVRPKFMVILFKKCQDLLTVNLKNTEAFLLNGNDGKEIEAKEISEMINPVLGEMESIAQFVAGINTKSYLEIWNALYKVYMKYQRCLLQIEYNFFSPISALCNEALRSTRVLLEAEEERRDVEQVSLFSLKILSSNIVTMFDNSNSNSINIYKKIWNFLMEMTQLTAVLHNNFQQRKQAIISNLRERLLTIFIALANMSKEIFSKTKNVNLTSIRHLIKWITYSKNKQQEYISPNAVENILNLVFDENYTDASKSVFHEESSIHDLLVEELAAFSLILSESSFAAFEEVLLKNLLSENVFSSLLASDIWFLFAKCTSKHSNYKFALVTQFLTKFNDFLNKQNLSQTPQFVNVKNFLRRIFILLEDEEKFKITKTFRCDLNNLGAYKCIVANNTIAIDVLNKLEMLQRKFEEGNISYEHFLFMCVLLETLTDVEKYDNNTKERITRLLSKFWSMYFEQEEEQLLTMSLDTLHIHFLKSLCQITSDFYQYLNRNTRFLIISKIFPVFCKAKCDVNKLGLIEIYKKNFDEIKSMALNSSVKAALERLIVDLKVGGNKNEKVTHCFIHKCLVKQFNAGAEISVNKKLKLNIDDFKSSSNVNLTETVKSEDAEDENMEVHDVIGELKKIVKVLKKYSPSDLSSKDKYQLQSAVGQLNNFFNR